MTALDLRAALSSLPPVWMAPLQNTAPRRIVVLDDDPTGTQTVSGVCVAAAWDRGLFEHLLREEKLFYVLTNTRSLNPNQAVERTRHIVCLLCEAAGECGVDFSLVSRGDSTLRGHFPAETDAAIQVLQDYRRCMDATVLIPAFPEGGRYTLHDTHWIEENGALIPVAQSEFAHDPAFGFESSHLPSWVEEKSSGQVPCDKVFCISLECIRCGGPDAVVALLQNAPRGATVIANAVALEDLRVLAAAFHVLERGGRRYLYRTAASFVAALGSLLPRTLTRHDIFEDTLSSSASASRGGLIVVGSHVGRSSAQLEYLLHHSQARAVELCVPSLLGAKRRSCIARAAQAVNELLAAGHDAVVFTSRERMENNNGAGYLQIGEAVSSGLVEMVRRVEAQPRFLIAKGGITSSEIATAALGCRVARVLGQVETGVAVWRMGRETRWPGLAYAVFPGNVGDEAALWRVWQQMQGRNHENN